MTDEQQPVTTPDLVDLHSEATDQSSVVDALLGLLEGAGRLRDADACRADLLAREAIGSTVIPGGVAIPQARTAGVDVPTVAVLRLTEPVAWSAGAGPVDVVLGLFTPAGDSDGQCDHCGPRLDGGDIAQRRRLDAGKGRVNGGPGLRRRWLLLGRLGRRGGLLGGLSAKGGELPLGCAGEPAACLGVEDRHTSGGRVPPGAAPGAGRRWPTGAEV